jgi:hypothetical protein
LEISVHVSKCDPFLQDDDEVVLVRVKHPAVCEMSLEQAPLAPHEALAQDHGELPATVDALDDVLGHGDADLKVSLVDAALELWFLVF